MRKGSDGTRLCTNCARIQRFQGIGDSFERKADSSIYWKCWILAQLVHIHIGCVTQQSFMVFSGTLCDLLAGHADFTGNLLRRDSCFRAPGGYHPAGNRK